jgi:diguanylate cyclase (GGDEF)-like protein/PAS domain S-box-containing protein
MRIGGLRLWRGMRGLRGRLALLCLLTAAPLLLILGLSGAVNYNLSVSSAESRALAVARNGAEQERFAFAETAHLLEILGHIPDIQGPDTATCYAVVHGIAEGDPRIDMITVSDAAGNMRCNSTVEHVHQSIADRAYFRQAMAAAPDDGPSSEVVINHLSGKPNIMAAIPMRILPEGAPTGVIAAALSSNWLSQLATRTTENVDHVAMVVDPTDGAIFGRAPPGAGRSGGRASDALVAALRNHPDGGSVRAPGDDGIDEIFGFSPMTFGAKRLMLVVGFDRQQVLSFANFRLRVGALLALVATLAALAIASRISTVFFIRPIALLSATAERLGGGDLSARAPAGVVVTELRALGLTFNRMAFRLQVRNRQLSDVQNALTESDLHHRLLADNSSDMIARFSPAFRSTYVSPAARHLLAYEPAELVGREPADIVHPDDRALLETMLTGPLKAGQYTARASYRALRKDGAPVWVESTGRRLPSGGGFVVVTRDVSVREEYEQQLKEANRRLADLAHQDALTGLGNRRRFDDMLALEYRRAARLRIPFGIVMIDIDRFKAYNDSYGHPAGDVCLRQVAAAVQQSVGRPSDFAARLGGEEFGILLPGTDNDGIRVLADRVCAAVRDLRLEHAGSEAGIVTVSVGAAVVSPHETANPGDLIELADRALYFAKRNGRNTYSLAEV